MRSTKDLIKIWTAALQPVCNHSASHASQEAKWLLLHAKENARRLDQRTRYSAQSKQSRLTQRAEQLSEQEVNMMQLYVDQRVKDRKPLQYILGSQPFMDLEILTKPPILIPRWETEEWTARLATLLKSESRHFRQQREEIVLSHPPSSPPSHILSQQQQNHATLNILDICTGTGCISLGIASALPGGSCNILGIDVNPQAVALATENKTKNHKVLNSNTVCFQQSDIFDPTAASMFQGWLENKLDHIGPTNFRSSYTGYHLVVANPPYIAQSEFESLEPEVAAWEDQKALLADQDGLVFYPRIANIAIQLLHDGRRSSRSPEARDCKEWNSIHEPSEMNKGSRTPRSWRNGPVLDKVTVPELVLEIGGDHQVEYVTTAVRHAGFSRVEVWKDLADQARCIVGAR
ncbi:hypothetical protein BGX31_008920 [Mortierella sp. GBA43]|nr:hypothetical protein BGX31_008920 [Mortierella sp. GBA43]